jgi:uncharacterized protein YceK
MKRLHWTSALILLASGCGTMVNMAAPNVSVKRSNVSVSTRMRRQIYGGVRMDVAILTKRADMPEHGRSAVAPLALVDLPFSAVGDTVTLPFTIADQFRTPPRGVDVDVQVRGKGSPGDAAPQRQADDGEQVLQAGGHD